MKMYQLQYNDSIEFLALSATSSAAAGKIPRSLQVSVLAQRGGYQSYLITKWSGAAHVSLDSRTTSASGGFFYTISQHDTPVIKNDKKVA